MGQFLRGMDLCRDGAIVLRVPWVCQAEVTPNGTSLEKEMKSPGIPGADTSTERQSIKNTKSIFNENGAVQTNPLLPTVSVGAK